MKLVRDNHGGDGSRAGAETRTQEDPDRAGAVIYFDTRQEYERYRDQRLPELGGSILSSSWCQGHAFEHVYGLEDIQREKPGRGRGSTRGVDARLQRSNSSDLSGRPRPWSSQSDGAASLSVSRCPLMPAGRVTDVGRSARSGRAFNP